MQDEKFSPIIENFSDSDVLFQMSQEEKNIFNINRGIMEVYESKTKYKRKKKIPNSNSLREKLRAANNVRLAQACKYARTDEGLTSKQRKIEVLEFSDYRRRLLLKFKFVDVLSIELENDELQHFLVVLPDLVKFIKLHSFYDVVFDLPKQEFMKNNYMHFAKLIRACRKY